MDSSEDYDQFTQELQLSGSLGERFKYTLGAFYFSNRWGQLQYGSTIGVPVEFSPVTHPGFTERFGGSYQDTFQNAKSYAVYFDGTWANLRTSRRRPHSLPPTMLPGLRVSIWLSMAAR